MNHEQFAAECPTLDFTVARHLCETHGAEIDDYVSERAGGADDDAVRLALSFADCERYDTLDLCRPWLI